MILKPRRSSVCLAIGCTLFAGLVCQIAGCGGDDGPPRYHVSGKATFAGKPIPAGQIVFDPDTAAGNSGPQGHAEILDGEFDTSQGHGAGTVGGPHIVRIMGLESKPVDPSVAVKPLFNDYATKADMPKEETTQNFDVPASAAKGMKTSNEPPP